MRREADAPPRGRTRPEARSVAGGPMSPVTTAAQDLDAHALDVATPDAFEAHFRALADALGRSLAAGERFTAWYEAEASDFVRFNRAKVRQAGRVTQQSVALRLIRGARHAQHALALSGDVAADAAQAVAALAGLRGALDDLADDPHLLLPDVVASSRNVVPATLPPRCIVAALAGPRNLRLGTLASRPGNRPAPRRGGDRARPPAPATTGPAAGATRCPSAGSARRRLRPRGGAPRSTRGRRPSAKASGGPCPSGPAPCAAR